MKKKKFLKLAKLQEYIVKYKTINRSLAQRIKFNNQLTEEFKEELRREQARNSAHILGYRKEFQRIFYDSDWKYE
jgi:hypothetical protein